MLDRPEVGEADALGLDHLGYHLLKDVVLGSRPVGFLELDFVEDAEIHRHDVPVLSLRSLGASARLISEIRRAWR